MTLRPNIEKLKKKKDVDGLIKALKYGEDPSIRKGAAAALGQLGDVRALEPLFTAIEEDNDDIKISAITSLGQLNDTRAYDILFSILKDENTNVALNAYRALTPIRENDYEECLYDGGAEMREFIENTETFDILIEALNDISPCVKCEAAEKLGLMGDARAIKPLFLKLLDTDSLPDYDSDYSRIYVSYSAEKALEEIDPPSDILDYLLNQLEHEEDLVRSCAVKMLGKLGDNSAIIPLINNANENTNDHYEVTRALAKIGEQAIKPLIATLDSANESVRQWIVYALGEFRNEEVIDVLVSLLLHDANIGIRKLAANSLYRLEWEPANHIEKLHYLFFRNEQTDIVQLGGSAVPFLIGMLNENAFSDQEGKTGKRMDAAWLLAKIGSFGSVKHLIELLKCHDEGNCSYTSDCYLSDVALEAIKMTGPIAMGPLIRAIKKGDIDVQDFNKIVLTIGKPAIQPIIDALGDIEIDGYMCDVAETLVSMDDSDSTAEALIDQYYERGGRNRMGAHECSGLVDSIQEILPTWEEPLWNLKEAYEKWKKGRRS